MAEMETKTLVKNNRMAIWSQPFQKWVLINTVV